jgi:hypothetical protein
VNPPRLIHATAGLTTAAGAPLRLALTLDAGEISTSLEIHRLELLPHKELRTTVLLLTAPTDGVVLLASAMTTISHELERLHRQGYWLRERSVGLRGIWHNDLCHPQGHLVQSWPTVARHPHKVVEPLAADLAGLDIPVTEDDEPLDRGEALEVIMREHGRELLRRHETDSYLAKHPMSSADELLDHLDRRGLLAPSTSASRTSGCRVPRLR